MNDTTTTPAGKVESNVDANWWSRLSWPLGALALLCAGATVTLIILNRSAIHSADQVKPIQLVVPIGYGIIGGFLASRRPRNPIGWIFLGIAILGGVQGVSEQYVFRSVHFHHLGLAAWAAWSDDWMRWLIFPGGLLVFFFLLFPDGHYQSRRWRWLGRVTAALMAIGAVLFMDEKTIQLAGMPAIRSPLGAAAIVDMNSPLGLIWFVAVATLLASMVGMIMRSRRSTGELREQLRWLAYATTLTFGGLVLVVTLSSSIFPNISPVWMQAYLVLGFGVAIPASCAIAILRHGLYEIDVVINKTVVYGLLAAFFTAVYVLIVVGLGTAVGSTNNPFLTLLAAALIALAFNPVRDRAKHLADRLVYGERATPYEVLSGFSEQMAGTYALEDILPRMARVLSEGTGGVAVIWLRVGDVLRSVARWPIDDGPSSEIGVSAEDLPAFPGVSQAVPVLHQGDLLGAITLIKPPNDPLRPTEAKLIADVASQAGLVLRNVRLIQELRASRQRLVEAQDLERRKIERNIHDGAQQQLVALAVKANLVEQLMKRDPERALSLVGQVKAELGDALNDLRDLARGIYPPLLADKGLAVALDAQARKSSVAVTVESDGLGRHRQDIEAAIYFCCLEALQNIAKYAEATAATVRLSDDSGNLTFEVTDDGRGFDPLSTGYGTGLQGMADRLDALGGSLEVRSAPGRGTTVFGRVDAT